MALCKRAAAETQTPDLQEARLLQQLNQEDDAREARVVRVLNSFKLGAHFCIVMEPLHNSLKDIILVSSWPTHPRVCSR